jgi:hypothetical protein
MSVQIQTLTPQSGQLEIDIRLSATVNVTAFSATQKVTGFVVDEISTNMHGGAPQLVVDQHIVWRVPVILSLPPTGDRGEVGAIDVNVETGQLMITRELVEEIERRAEYLVL